MDERNKAMNQHPPDRKTRCDFPKLKMPTVESEIKLIEAISQANVMAIALRHFNINGLRILDFTYKLQSGLFYEFLNTC